MLNIFIGYDSREPIAYHVLAHSILRRSTVPVTIAPVKRELIPDFTRPRGAKESTEFSLSRFMVPHMTRYMGVGLFMDCDMLCRVDVAELDALLRAKLAFTFNKVAVCPHDYEPKTDRKFLGQQQTKYPRKNWSSFMAFNAVRCGVLAPEYVNNAPALDLHRFGWAQDDEILHLPLEWNWLVGEYKHNERAKFAHFTLGGPWFKDYTSCDYADEWREEREHMEACG